MNPAPAVGCSGPQFPFPVLRGLRWPKLLALRADRPQALAQARPGPGLDFLVASRRLTPRRCEVLEPGVGLLDQQQLVRFSSRRGHRNHLSSLMREKARSWTGRTRPLGPGPSLF